MIVELLRDDGTVADVQEVPDSAHRQITFRSDIVGRFTHARVTMANGLVINEEIAPYIMGGNGVTAIVTIWINAPVYVNPAWRWYHGDNCEWLDQRGGIYAEPCGRCGQTSLRSWFGLPKPEVTPLEPTLRRRFEHLREQAWLFACGPEQRTLAVAQADMREWPHLFAFHAFTAIAMSRPDDFDVLLDRWEAANLGTEIRLGGAMRANGGAT